MCILQWCGSYLCTVNIVCFHSCTLNIIPSHSITFMHKEILLSLYLIRMKRYIFHSHLILLCSGKCGSFLKSLGFFWWNGMRFKSLQIVKILSRSKEQDKNSSKIYLPQSWLSWFFVRLLKLGKWPCNLNNSPLPLQKNVSWEKV
jgi:hypothetical protein